MDNKPADKSLNSRKSWHLVLWLARFLNRAEREAVLGDLSEYGESGAQTIANILGLVVRRKTAVLLDLRLWLYGALLILPISYMLSAITQSTAAEGAVYSWMYLNNWDWTLTRSPGFWHVLREMAMNLGIACLILAGWSWSAGFLIGRFPNSVRHASRNAFFVLTAASFLVHAPTHFIDLCIFLRGLPSRSPIPDYNSPVTANLFYYVFFPSIVLAVLAILPAFSGIRHGSRSLLLERKIQVFLVTAATISVLIMLTHMPGIGLLLGEPAMEWLWRNRNAMQVLPLLCCWPMFYVVAVGLVRHRWSKACLAQRTPCT